MATPGGANRIELESQILCAALRQSWADTDAVGVVKACQELYELYPDLLPPPKGEQTAVSDATTATPPSNYYEMLSIECDVNPSMVNAAYLKRVKQFLREHPNPNEAKNEYYAILNAGYILRKPRLRLSHDLLVCKAWLDEHQVISETFELIELESSGVDSESIDFTPPPPVVPFRNQTNSEPLSLPQPAVEERLPMLIDLLKASGIIGSAEVQALKNQMSLYPDVTLVDLVLQAGYVTDLEMKSLQLAEYLLTSGRINLGQFKQAMMDEIRTGRRMASNLDQPPPWDIDDNWGPRGESPPPDEELPPPKARVPRKPKPSGGSNHLKLVPPKPPEPDPDNPKI